LIDRNAAANAIPEPVPGDRWRRVEPGDGEAANAQMANGRWQMADGKWQMADGKWQMADGRWQMADGKWQMANRE